MSILVLSKGLTCTITENVSWELYVHHIFLKLRTLHQSQHSFAIYSHYLFIWWPIYHTYQSFLIVCAVFKEKWS